MKNSKLIKLLSSKKLKINIVDITAALIVLILAGIVIVPSLLRCVENRRKTVCDEHMYAMMNILSTELTKEMDNEGSYWHDLIKNGNYQKLITSLHDKTHSNVFPSSDYYIQTDDEKITLFCKRHQEIAGHSLSFGIIQNTKVEVAEQSMLGEQIAYLSVSGPDTYYQDEQLDERAPWKMTFRGREVDKVIQDLTVTAVYVGGASEVLDRGRYTITAEKLDMSKSGQTRLTIKSNSRTIWDNSAYAPFVIDVIGKDDVAPLIVDGGISGKFRLAAWDWSDFVEEASQEEDGKDFGASIICHNGNYYYYPDGLHISNANQNDTPFSYALDIDNREQVAYYIKFDTDSVALTEDDEKDLHSGSLKIDNDLVYIWQEVASKELDIGWIRVYCEMEKY